MSDPSVRRAIPKGVIITVLAGCIMALAAAPASAQGGGWQIQAPSFDVSNYALGDVSALDPNHVWIVGGIYVSGGGCVLRSSDAGATWAQACQPDLDQANLRIKMVSPTVGYVGGYGSYSVSLGGWTGVIRRTADGGSTWTSDNSFVPGGVVYGLTASDDQYAWAAGSLTSGNLAVIHHRVTGTPPTWTRDWTSVAGGYLAGVSAVDSTTAWAVGSGGRILKTTDAGAHWVAQTPPSGPGYDSSTYFNDVAAIDINTAWIIADDYVFKTTDGGASWQMKLELNSEGLTRIAAANANVAWVIGRSSDVSTIYHTSDGGATWDQQPAGTSAQLNGITAVDANNVWIAAEYGVILHTTDGGTGAWAAPTIASVTPNHGGEHLSTTITIVGTGFRYPVRVSVGGVAMGDEDGATLIDSTTVQVDLSQLAAGAYDVTLTNGDGQKVTRAGGFTYDPAPVVTSISPTYGTTAGGFQVTVRGTRFASGAVVVFGGIYGFPLATTFVNSTTLQATVPATQYEGAPWVPGPLTVAVINPDGQDASLSNGFRFADPTVFQFMSVVPTSGPDTGGTPVTISGYAFQPGDTVLFGGVAATDIVVVDANTITARTPAHAAGSVTVSGHSPGGADASLGGFTYQTRMVTTVPAATSGPVAMAMDNSGNTYVAESSGGRVLRIDWQGNVETMATLGGLGGIAVIPASGTVFVTEVQDHRIRQITADGTVTTLAGGTQGSADGNGASAQFNSPCGLVFGGNGLLYVADRDNHRVRQVNPNTGDVTTVAGSSRGYLDAVGTAARFDTPTAVAMDMAGVLYVADTGGARIRKIARDGTVTTLAGNGTPGFADGAGTAAEFLTPLGVAVDAAGWVSVADTGNHRIRQIAPDGTVTTLAGTGNVGLVDGPASAAQFSSPAGVAVNVLGAVYVADQGNDKLRKVASTVACPTLTMITPASGPAAGGTPVWITGTGFVTGATVAFAGSQATGVNVASETSITVTTPSSRAGYALVAVRNPDGQLAAVPGGFVYDPLSASIALGALRQTYNGNPRPVTATTTPPGLSVFFSYVGVGTTVYGPSSLAPSGAGSYTVTASVNDGTYLGTATDTLIVVMPPVIPVDLGGVGRSDVVVFRGADGAWWIKDQTSALMFGQAGDIPVVADYDGDGHADLAVYRPSTSEWIIKDQRSMTFGQTGDVPVPGDYNGDGKAEIAVFRPSAGEWMVDGRPGVTTWGMRGDIPAPADYNGDGVVEFAVFRPTTGVWYVQGGETLEWGMWGDVPVAADYNGDGQAEIAVYRPSTGWWYVARGPMAQWGASGDLPVPLDVDGDGATDFVVFRPTTGDWYAIDPVTSATTSYAWGQAGDEPVGLAPRLPVTPLLKTAGDFDGDGSADVTVFRPSTGGWYTLQSTHAYRTVETVVLGQDGDIPVPGDYQGTGHQERAVYRPSTGQWLLEDGRAVTLGAPGDVPVPGDYDGDGITDVAVFQPSTGLWSILTGASGFTTLMTHLWGAAGDVPAPGDFDGDGKTDFAVFTPATGQWSIRSSLTGTTLMTLPWGMAGDIPVPADYDGDGKTDIGVYRPSTGYWYGLFSKTDWSFQWAWWGAEGDIPVPGDYNGDGQAEVAVFRPSNGAWYVMDVMTIVGWGTSTDVPILARK